MRIMLNVTDVSRFHPMLSYEPELISETSIAHWRAPWLPRLPSLRFEQRISGERQTHRKREFDWRVENIFLERVNDTMLHFSRAPRRAILALAASERRIVARSANGGGSEVIMATEVIPAPKSETIEHVLDSQQTTCCVVGGGPGGMMLALLLARKGVRVTVLEAHKDFDRDFRGDTIHPSILEILDELGLAEPLHKLRHVKAFGPTLRAANTSFSPFDFRRLNTKFPYIMLIPQTKFLEFIASEASKYPEFQLKMTANVESLIEDNGSVLGVRYLSTDGLHEVRATLTVGADGRFFEGATSRGIRADKDIAADGHSVVSAATPARRPAG